MFGEVIAWIILTLAIVSILSAISGKYGHEIAIGVFASLTVVANIIAFKIVTFGSFVVPAAVIVYASTFLVTDFLSEVYGRSTAVKAVWAGFLSNIIMVLSVMIAVKWEPASFMDKGLVESFNTVLGFAPRVVIASMIAFLISQHHDVWAFHFWKEKMKGKYLWMRNNLSTLVSQLIDTVIFISIAFAGKFPVEVISAMVLGQYIVKVIIALLDTPFIYLCVKISKIFSPS